MHPENKSFINLVLSVFHFEISGKYNNEEHPINKHDKIFTLLIFHFEISGKDIRELQPLNIPLII